jgi:hypothetical protein
VAVDAGRVCDVVCEPYCVVCPKTNEYVVGNAYGGTEYGCPGVELLIVPWSTADVDVMLVAASVADTGGAALAAGAAIAMAATAATPVTTSFHPLIPEPSSYFRIELL